MYDLLLAQNNDNPGLLATMGTLYIETGQYGLAISLLHRAAKLKPQSDVWCNLAIAYKKSGQMDKAHIYFKKAASHKPTPDALGNYSALFTNNGTPDEAIKIAKKSLKLDPNCHMAHWNMALAMLEKGMWETAWEEHEWGLKNGMRTDREIGGVPYWDGTEGKTIVVYGEQGLGDEIMFATMLPDLMKKNTVIFECHQRLKHLFEESFPGLICYGTREEKKIYWHNDHKIDYRVSIGSLGKWYRTKQEDFTGLPYLKVKEVEKPEKFRVGISWTGGLKPGRIVARSVPLSMWGMILDNDCEFVSLQYTDCKEDIDNMESFGHKIIRDDRVFEDDYYKTAELVKSMIWSFLVVLQSFIWLGHWECLAGLWFQTNLLGDME